MSLIAILLIGFAAYFIGVTVIASVFLTGLVALDRLQSTNQADSGAANVTTPPASPS